MFRQDSLPGPHGNERLQPGRWPGGDLGRLLKKVTPSVVLNDAVFAANTIGPQRRGRIGGRGIYAACEST